MTKSTVDLAFSSLHLHLLEFSMDLPLPFLLFTFVFSYPQLAATSKPPPARNNLTDLESLLAFRAHADPHGILAANWTANTSFCNWVGVRCSSRRQRVTAIRLANFSLGGTISPHLGNLSFLSELDLDNNSLTGPIPESIGYLPRLAHLLLQSNSLSGPFPLNIFNVSSLLILGVGPNNLTGSLPSNNGSITMPSGLLKVSLLGNHFTGDVLSSFLRCRDIQMINLGDNQFGGTMPAEIGSLSELRILDLGGNRPTGASPSPSDVRWNHLSGTIPASLGNLTKLTVLDLSSNNFSGMLPEEMGNLRNLQYLSLAGNGNMFGSIPTSLLNMSKLYNLDLSLNKFTGPVPSGIGKSLPLLQWFHVGFNHLSGGLEFISSLSNCKNLDYLEIYKNTLEGVLPGDVGNLSTTSLQYFDASGNLFKGSIPSSLGNLSGLIELDLYDNKLIGIMPSALEGLESLQYVSLAFNDISGLVPSELGLLKNLNEVHLEYNALYGPIPDSFFNSSSMMQILDLRSNNLSSSIPQSFWTSKNLLQVDLSWNALDGLLPPQVGNLKDVTSLDLSMNRLSGKLPSELGNLQVLNYLDLSKNSFNGQIPESLGGLISVAYLNLSSNLLSGIIPKPLANLPHLDSVDLSHNELEGQVPKGRVSLNSSIPSLFGNKALCGAPQLHIPPCDILIMNSSRRKVLSLKYILVISISAVVLLIFLCLIYAFYSRRKLKSLPDASVPCLDNHRAISYHELVRATEKFSEVNLVGRGGFGSVFRGCLDDGLVVAVKVLHLEVEGSSKSFNAECQVLKMVRHKNLIKIISVCSNLDFKALILEYMPNGSLERWLYSDNYFLNLMQRLNIMVDVSLALEYLHHRHPQVVLHCDLKPTNILLDEEMVAHVSDFGIAKLLLDDSRSMATASMPGTIGYIAPEYATTGTVSRMGDVYSFGVLLLETFTKKKPVDSMFGEQSSLREWICKAHPTATLDVVDVNLLKCHARNDGPSQDLATLHQCLSSVIELGLLCSRYSPKERIPMTDVVARLQKIKMEYVSSSTYS